MSTISRVRSAKYPREAKRDRSRELLLAAAKLFAERGFAPVTIRDIASSIEVNTGVIYYYYPNKEALFGAAVEHLAAISLQQYRASVVDCDEPVELLDRWFQVVVDNLDIVNRLMKIMYDYSKSDMKIEGVDAAITLFYSEERRFLTSAIKQGIERKQFRQVEADRVALFISTHLDGIVVRSAIQPDIDVAEAVNELRKMMWARLGNPSSECSMTETDLGVGNRAGSVTSNG